MKQLASSLLVFSLFSTSVCVAGPVEIIEKAEALRLKTAEVGFEWTTTSILIKQAKQAVKDGNSGLAEKLATEAINQAESSLKQAEFAAANWQNSEPE